jgi:hypothetical protein
MARKGWNYSQITTKWRESEEGLTRNVYNHFTLEWQA